MQNKYFLVIGQCFFSDLVPRPNIFIYMANDGMAERLQHSPPVCRDTHTSALKCGWSYEDKLKKIF